MDAEEKPKDIDQYKKWLTKCHEIEITDRIRSHYESVARKVKIDFENSGFWHQLIENLDEFDSQYQVATGYHLLIPKFEPELVMKPFDSFLLKTFRKSVLDNEQWPNPPGGEWIFPINYSSIDDVIRTLLVVKYLDGVEFMIEKIRSLCHELGLPCNVTLEAKEEGYYAAHLYISCEFEVPSLNWDTERTHFSVEIQITTQIQDVIRKLLHKYYEIRRKKPIEAKEVIKWQWDYKSDEFVANYLGHILHYAEGMIMEIREKQKEKVI